ncbi:predicted protein [Uncinocarpus reesii 1704]|uniref:Uncharacterized protein n=1 Tax=Uncinocarpus reesii (strain UAMH 1704) TaxID=336963 RepID=C4JKQ3_UNCRE|nr:uncharacterized protein UREG_00651 [Uncinocarpus reesii 1704]EEP75804.1 predicted protein [Uncinocarpus reesii 1704]
MSGARNPRSDRVRGWILGLVTGGRLADRVENARGAGSTMLRRTPSCFTCTLRCDCARLTCKKRGAREAGTATGEFALSRSSVANYPVYLDAFRGFMDPFNSQLASLRNTEADRIICSFIFFHLTLQIQFKAMLCSSQSARVGRMSGLERDSCTPHTKMHVPVMMERCLKAHLPWLG